MFGAMRRSLTLTPPPFEGRGAVDETPQTPREGPTIEHPETRAQGFGLIPHNSPQTPPATPRRHHDRARKLLASGEDRAAETERCSMREEAKQPQRAPFAAGASQPMLAREI